jgi:hypothetical protein
MQYYQEFIIIHELQTGGASVTSIALFKQQQQQQQQTIA